MPIIEHLIADTFGTHIGKYSERLKITQASETLAQAPLLHTCWHQCARCRRTTRQTAVAADVW